MGCTRARKLGLFMARLPFLPQVGKCEGLPARRGYPAHGPLDAFQPEEHHGPGPPPQPESPSLPAGTAPLWEGERAIGPGSRAGPGSWLSRTVGGLGVGMPRAGTLLKPGPHCFSSTTPMVLNAGQPSSMPCGVDLWRENLVTQNCDPLSLSRVYLSHLCFSDVARHGALHPPKFALSQPKGSHREGLKLPNEWHRTIWGIAATVLPLNGPLRERETITHNHASMKSQLMRS